MEMQDRRSDSRSPDGEHEDRRIVHSFIIQTVSSYNPRTQMPWRNNRLYLYSDNRMGVAWGDFHGEWWFEGEVMSLAYNYRGRHGVDNAVSVYVPITGTSSWMSAPPHLFPNQWTPNISVLIPIPMSVHEPLPWQPPLPAKRQRGEGV